MAGRSGSPRSAENRRRWAERGSGTAPFARDNGAAVKHGARSPKIVAPLADSLVTEIVAAMPVLGEPRFARAVRAWAVAEARCERMRSYMATVSPAEASAEKGSGSYELQAERLALRLREGLALDLASAARVDYNGSAAGSEAARSMVSRLFADVRRVVGEGREEEVEHAAVVREGSMVGDLRDQLGGAR